jgi:tetratricopeptide (TPR) repeat protein
MGRRDNRRYGNQGRDQINIEGVNGNVLLNSQEAVRPDAEKDLIETVRRWVESRLEGQLHHAVKLNLQKEAQPQQVRPWGMEMKVAIAQSSQLLPPETTIGQVFDQCLGRLLILGEPGAGKTTSLLDLALELVERAEDDPQQRIPVIVDLSDWKPTASRSISKWIGLTRQNFLNSSSEKVPGWSIANWLSRKVRERYGVPPKQIKQWLEEKRLVPLLDGLDEVSPEYQKDCVQAINLWLNSDFRPRQVAVCCRREPYETYSEKLKLDGAVYLQDLTDEQIQTFLAEANRDELRQSLVADKNLLELIRRPLLLSMAVIAYKELKPIPWQQATSAGDRLNLLIDAYVRQMLTQDTLSRAYRNRKPPSQEESRKWLEFLALQLLQESETEFLIERIHTTWLSTLVQICLFNFLAVAVWGLIFAVAFWVVPTTVFFWLGFFSSIKPFQMRTGLNAWFRFGFSIGSMYGLLHRLGVWKNLPYIESTVRNIGNSLSNLLIPPKVLTLIYRLSELAQPKWGFRTEGWILDVKNRSVLNQGIKNLLPNLILVILINVPLGLISLFSKLGELVQPKWGFRYEEWIFNVKNMSVPNQGINNLLRNAVLIALIVLPLHILAAHSLLSSIPSLGYIILVSSCISLLLWVWLGGGNVCVNHFLVRLCLSGTNSIPWNYVRFLNYATERLLLQRTGSSYRFIHDLLRQSLAQSRINSYPHLVSPQVSFRCGKSYCSMEQYNNALNEFNRAIKLDPRYFEAIAERGSIYLLMKRDEEALQDFNHAIALNPKYDWAIAKRGFIYMLMKRYEEALQDFNRAIELNPKYDWAIAERGLTYRYMEQYEEALQDFNRAIELDPKEAWAIANRGITYRFMERYEEALQDFNRAIELDPKYYWAIAQRGHTYRDMERYEEALQDFNRAVELYPKEAWAIAARGHTYRFMGRYEEALQDFNRAIELDPKDAWAIAGRGFIYTLMNRYEEALQDFNCAVELNPKYDWCLYLRALNYLICDQVDRAKADLNKAIQIAQQGQTQKPNNYQNTLRGRRNQLKCSLYKLHSS